METNKKLIKALKAIGVVREEAINLKHAGASYFYIDIKKAYGYPDVLNLMCGLMRERMNKKVNCVAACGYGGLSLAGAIASKYGLNLILLREKPKKHGRNVWIDGYVPKSGDRVWIIDDVLTTGKSISRMIKTLKPTRAKILGCGVVADRSAGKTQISYKSILKFEELA